MFLLALGLSYMTIPFNLKTYTADAHHKDQSVQRSAPDVQITIILRNILNVFNKYKNKYEICNYVLSNKTQNQSI